MHVLSKFRGIGEIEVMELPKQKQLPQNETGIANEIALKKIATLFETRTKLEKPIVEYNKYASELNKYKGIIIATTGVNIFNFISVWANFPSLTGCAFLLGVGAGIGVLSLIEYNLKRGKKVVDVTKNCFHAIDTRENVIKSELNKFFIFNLCVGDRLPNDVIGKIGTDFFAVTIGLDEEFREQRI